jgi:hypothetical protein
MISPYRTAEDAARDLSAVRTVDDCFVPCLVEGCWGRLHWLDSAHAASRLFECLSCGSAFTSRAFERGPQAALRFKPRDRRGQ